MLHNMPLLAAKHADFGGVTVHCDQIKPLLRTRRHAYATETATPWNRSPAARMLHGDRNRPSPGSREAFWSHDWEPSCALLAVLVPKQKKLLRPLGVLGATEQHPCVATESATDEVESGALLVDNQLSCNIGNLADEFISAIYQHTQRPLDWQHCTI